MRALSRVALNRVGLLVAWNTEPPPINSDEQAASEALAAAGVTILPEVRIRRPTLRPRLSRWALPKLEDLHPEAMEAAVLQRAVAAFEPDVLLPVWTEWLTAALSFLAIDKFAYYGNPDLKSVSARTEFLRNRGAIGWAEYWKVKRFVERLEPVHQAAMNRYRWLGNVAANDAAYYAGRGHPNAFYIQNTWFDRFGSAWRERREVLEHSGRNRILANVGKLSGTANTLGLHYLATRLLPELLRLKNDELTLRICGAGTLQPDVQSALRHPAIQMAGFVDDIDLEIVSSAVFLCVNNATSYKVGHTRYLHAWSLGSCVVAHRDAALSMPEIVHDENALLGEDERHLAELLDQALKDRRLRRRIGEGGYETFRQYFLADVVAPRILGRIEGPRVA